ncbi:MAG: hypothetical protein AAFY03_12565, partial [Pseudomonadota bacterium]
MDVSSLAYDPELCALWVADESSSIWLLAPDGSIVREIETGLGSAKTLAVEGDQLLVASGWGEFRRFDRLGRALGAPFGISDALVDTEGLEVEPSGTILIAEDDPARILRLGPDGSVLLEISGEQLNPPMLEPQGVTRDPMSGHILVVDDMEGSDSLFEFTADGELISVTPLGSFGMDAEAVAVNGQTGILYVGFDSGRRLVAFDYIPSPHEGSAPLPQK